MHFNLDIAICINEGNFVWEKGQSPVLKQINLSIPKGSLVAIVGSYRKRKLLG